MIVDPVFIGGVILISYLAGAIPFGLVFTHLAGKGDIRAIGSGNIGTTNVLRTGSKPLAALTLIFDAGKGAVIILIAVHFASTGDNAATGETIALISAISGLSAVIGHCFPIWLGFKGGKGVATALAVFSTYDLRLGGLFVALWLSVAFIFRFSSLAALTATLGCVAAAFLLGLDMAIVTAMVVITGIIWVRHHENIGRLLAGTESKIGKK